MDPAHFGAATVIEVDPGEPHGANAVLIEDAVLMPAAFPKTRARLEAAGIAVTAVDLSELAKAEGAAACCSLIFRP